MDAHGKSMFTLLGCFLLAKHWKLCRTEITTIYRTPKTAQRSTTRWPAGDVEGTAEARFDQLQQQYFSSFPTTMASGIALLLQLGEVVRRGKFMEIRCWDLTLDASFDGRILAPDAPWTGTDHQFQPFRRMSSSECLMPTCKAFKSYCRALLWGHTRP